MTSVSAVELEHCREVALVADGVFEFTSRYLPADELERYLALYALVQIVHSIPGAAFDDSVKWAKLKWWSGEFAAEPGSASRHPVMRALWNSGARVRIDDALLQRLVNESVMQIDVAPDSDEKGLFERLASLGTASVALELALEGGVIDHQSLSLLAAASALLGLLSGFCLNGQAEFDQIPLSVLAKYQLSATQLESKEHRSELELIVAKLAGDGLDWFSKGMSGLASRSDNKAGKHLQLRWAMERRRMASIQKNANEYLDAGSRYGPTDAWFAWRFLRRLN